MNRIVQTVVLEDNKITLQEAYEYLDVTITESEDGHNLIFEEAGTGNLTVVNTLSFIGALKALTTKGDRDRLLVKNGAK